jgi:hypothetical protein
MKGECPELASYVIGIAELILNPKSLRLTYKAL